MTSVSIDRPIAGRPTGQVGPSPLARAGMRLWRLFTSVNFAVVQIVAVAVLAVFGMTIRQLPGFAFRSAADYAAEMNRLRSIYEPVLGVGPVDLLERLQLFHVFNSTPFSIALLVLVISILICTLDRTPRLWQQSATIRVVQPDAYFDPRLPDRVSIAPGPGLTAGAVAAALRRHRYVVRETVGPGDATFVYGDRNRWTKLATLISHLGLILFLVAGLVTARFGDEQGLVVAEGDTLTVQPIGTPGLLLVQNLGFEAPGLETGNPSDFTTDLAVFQDGQLLARKTIRVNDPLAVGGYTFHQNGFGPAPDLEIKSKLDDSVLWSGPVPLTDTAGGLPYGAMPIPGRPFGLEMLLSKTKDGIGVLAVLPYAIRGTLPDGTPDVVRGDLVPVVRGDTVDMGGLDMTVELRGFSQYTLLIAKRDPGQGIVWAAFLSLIVGLAITFYLPRRRVWTRLGGDGRLDVVGRADRHVDFDREFGGLIDDLVVARAAARALDELRVTDLAALADELFPGAQRTVAGAARPIAWVRVMRGRVPAFDALEPGDLVIVPASALRVVAPGAGELEALVAALAAVPVSGAILAQGEADGEGTADLEGASATLAAAGVDSVRVQRDDLAALERSVVGFIVGQGAELERQASLLESELRRRALEGGGVAGLIATVSAFLGRALALEAGRGAPIVVHAPAQAPGAAAEAARYEARSQGRAGAVALRVELPPGAGVSGSLLVLGAEPASELARVTLPRVAGLVALELARDEAIRGALDRARRAEPMPAGGPPWVMILARQREPGGEDDTPAARDARESARRAVRLLAPARRMNLRGDADSLEIRAVAAGDLAEAAALAERVGELLGRPVAVSRPFASPADRPSAEAEARATLEAALVLDRPPRLARADRLAIYRMLGAMHKLPDGRPLALAVLAPLLEARPDVRRERIETLRAILGHGGVSEAAAALGVHRNTVAYRLRRIEAATGWQLADPELRLPLAAALEFVQEDQV